MPDELKPPQPFTHVLDSGVRRTWDTGAVRDIAIGKGRFDLLPNYALTRYAQHMENGSVKYGDRNWEKGQPLSTYLNSAIRHLYKVVDGQMDEDHAAATVWNMMAFIETLHRIEIGTLPENLADLPWYTPREHNADATG